MLKRLIIICFGLGCFTTFIAIQQTHRYKLHYDKLLSSVYKRFSERRRHRYATSYMRSTRHSQISSSYAYHDNRAVTQGSLVERYYQELFNSRSFAGKDALNNNPKYSTENLLLPVLFYNMGPNNLFRIFKETIPIAYSMKRTLVVPPFHHHPRMKRVHEGGNNKKSRDTMDVDIFDQTYKSVVETDAEKTIDMRSLKQLMPAIPTKDFQSKCGNRIDTLITCGSMSGKRSTGLDHFKQVMNVSVSRVYAVDDFRDVVDGKKLKVNLLSAMHKTRDDRCVGLALGGRCLGSRGAWFNHWQPFSPFIRRPANIKVLAREFVKELFRDQPFLAVHWRYENEDWQDMCKASRPDSVRKINEPMCEMALQLASNVSMLHSLASRLQSYAAQNDMKFIYFAAPPQLLNTLKQLKSDVPGLHIVSDVLKFAKGNQLMTNVFDNNFSTSFLEQEICYLASIFLGSPLSSWTQTVMLDRAAEGITDYLSVLDVVVADSSDLPKLTWYFPEGN